MWLTAEYLPVGLFSLKNAMATSSGGKSLLVPTPYAFKMALLDAACRLWGVSQAETMWPTIRDLPMAVRLPRQAVVTNMFAKVLRPRRNPAKPGTPHAGPLGKTIAFREYVWASGKLIIALDMGETDSAPRMAELLLQINYLGKRGGFVQLRCAPETVNELPDGFVLLNPSDGQESFDSNGLMQMLDDCGPKMTFEHANIYSGKSVRLGRERVLNHVVLPFRLTRSSKSYSLYERLED
jgi:hypothetical protein